MQHIMIPDADMDRLRQMLDSSRRNVRDQEHLERLEEELDRAHVLLPKAVPRDVVTMNSWVRVRDLATGKTSEYTLVYPQGADLTRGRVSVLAPLGTAVLGCQAGEIIEWMVPGGKRQLRLEKVVQPSSLRENMPEQTEPTREIRPRQRSARVS
jgi:regulator of nucleoside diphosphate kinase